MEGSKKNTQAEIAYNMKKANKLNRSINFSNVINLMNDSGVSGEKNFVSNFATQVNNPVIGQSSVPLDDDQLKE
jgi:hypothetical protein